MQIVGILHVVDEAPDVIFGHCTVDIAHQETVMLPVEVKFGRQTVFSF